MSSPANRLECDWHVDANGDVLDSESRLVARLRRPQDAAQIVKEHNAHRKLVEALEVLRSTLRPILRNHEVRGNVDRTEGYVLVALNQIDDALAEAKDGD